MKLLRFLPSLRNRPLVIRRVVGESMAPVLQPGQIVIGSGWIEPRVGDIVIAHMKGREVIKRVTVLEGPLVELIGDNRSASSDSRDHGAIKRDMIIARVFVP